ncbi:MAG TPA: DUF6596 domain-containing protein, partial [Pseudonocardia sp.]|nr:DUF6596 domain-containing protein [Pseudonocardia sp.]
MTGPRSAAAGGGGANAVVEDVAREARARLVAYLASVTGDLAAAEDALSEAFLAALRTWPERGIPARPDSWLVTAARRSLIDAARRREVAARALPELARLADEQAAAGAAPVVDRRLELMFACTHPAIDPNVRSPLMLQAVLGLDAARIAAAFLVAPASMGQRLVRAKAKIKRAGVPFTVPDRAEFPQRVSAVLDAIYVAYTTGWDDLPASAAPEPAATGAGAAPAGLAPEALRLARLVTELVPGDPEARGLLALLLHSSARTAARRTAAGEFVPLDEQDTAAWSRPLIEQAEQHLAAAFLVAPASMG